MISLLTPRKPKSPRRDRRKRKCRGHHIGIAFAVPKSLYFPPSREPNFLDAYRKKPLSLETNVAHWPFWPSYGDSCPWSEGLYPWRTYNTPSESTDIFATRCRQRLCNRRTIVQPMPPVVTVVPEAGQCRSAVSRCCDLLWQLSMIHSLTERPRAVREP